MKSKIVTLAVAAMMLFATTFAQNNNDGTNENRSIAFLQQFPKATNVNWETKDTYSKVRFESNGQNLVAFFTKNGDLMGVTRNMLSTELPVYLKAVLDKDYSEFWISELFEYVKDGESKYYAAIEQGNQRIILESVGSNDWSKFKTTTV